MSDPEGAQDRIDEKAWERAWIARYGAGPRKPAARAREGRRGARRPPITHLLIATAALASLLSSLAIAESGSGTSDVRQAGGAARVGDPITLGERNPRSGGAGEETSIVADAGNGGLVLRPSNTAKGGRAISATCDNDGVTEEDGCAVYVNKGQGAAATFRTNGSVPFALRSTNNGLVRYLNSDLVDGKSASDFLGASSKAADSEALDGQDSSAFLRTNGKAADSETLDGQDSSAFLGANAKAADANLLDGVESDDFVRVSGLVNGSNGNPLSTGITSTRTGEGAYTVTINSGTFANSGTSCSLLRPVISPVGNEFHAAVWNEAGCLIGGGGQFDVLTFDAAGVAEDATFGFVVDVVP